MAPVREYMRKAGGDRSILEKGRVEVCFRCDAKLKY